MCTCHYLVLPRQLKVPQCYLQEVFDSGALQDWSGRKYYGLIVIRSLLPPFLPSQLFIFKILFHPECYDLVYQFQRQRFVEWKFHRPFGGCIFRQLVCKHLHCWWKGIKSNMVFSCRKIGEHTIVFVGRNFIWDHLNSFRSCLMDGFSEGFQLSLCRFRKRQDILIYLRIDFYCHFIGYIVSEGKYFMDDLLYWFSLIKKN